MNSGERDEIIFSRRFFAVYFIKNCSFNINIISNIVNASLDNNPYFNPCRTDIYMITEMILAYTNISVTEKQKEDICKLYDSFVSSGLAALIINNIPSVDYNFIYGSVNTTIQNIYKYKNGEYNLLKSVFGGSLNVCQG